MSNAPRFDLENDGYFGWAVGVLWLGGGFYVFAGLFSLVFMAAPILAGPRAGAGEGAILFIFGLVFLVMMGGFAFANFAAAWGLKRRKKWAWIVALIVGAIYAPSACLPFGLLILYALLRTGVKESYDADARALDPAPTTF